MEGGRGERWRERGVRKGMSEKREREKTTYL